MSKEKIPKRAPSDRGKKPQTGKPDELSKEELDKATGGLVPAVGPQK